MFEPQAAETGRGAQLPEPRALRAGDLDGLLNANSHGNIKNQTGTGASLVLEHASNNGFILVGNTTNLANAAVSVGVSISFGMLDVVNIAHPGFIILGSYIAYIVNDRLGFDPIVVSLVRSPRTTSTTFMSGTGLKK